MKNGVEVRPNGVRIQAYKRLRDLTTGTFRCYLVEGSKNGPWDYLRNARKDADSMTEVK
jgi:hypothetical protein